MATILEKPKLKNGDLITPDTFNNIYDTIEEETNNLDTKYEEIVYYLRLEIMNLQDEQTRNFKCTRILQGVIYILCVFILVLFLCIILGVF